MSGLAIYNYDGSLINTIASSVPFTSTTGSAVRRLNEVTNIVSGSGYTDTEIAQTNDNLQASFSGVTDDQNVEYQLNWAKGIASIALDAGTSTNMVSSSSTNVTLEFTPNDGWLEITKATGTFSLRSRRGNRILDSGQITNPGLYIVSGPTLLNPVVSDIPVKVNAVVNGGEILPLGSQFTFNFTVSNYLHSVNIINKGGGISQINPLLTLDAPANKAGDANIAAATAIFFH